MAGDSKHFIFATTHGGVTWEEQDPGTLPEGWFTDVAFVDAQHGWVMAVNYILATADGGSDLGAAELAHEQRSERAGRGRLPLLGRRRRRHDHHAIKGRCVLAGFVPPETSVTSDLTRWVTTPGGAELGFSVSDTASPSLKGHVVRAQAKAVRAAGVAPVTQTSLDSGKSWQSSERHLVTAQGETAFLSRSIDQAGNIETARTSSVRVDNQAPESDDDAPTGTVDGPVAVRLDAIDAVFGVATIEYRRQGPSVGP